MCLGIPGKVIDIHQNDGILICKVDFGGVFQDACVETIPDIKVGEYVIVHAGFAISRMSETDAQETLQALKEIDLLNEEIQFTDTNLDENSYPN